MKTVAQVRKREELHMAREGAEAGVLGEKEVSMISMMVMVMLLTASIRGLVVKKSKHLSVERMKVLLCIPKLQNSIAMLIGKWCKGIELMEDVTDRVMWTKMITTTEGPAVKEG